WLENEADVADPAAQLVRDPTNPWLYLAVAEDQPARRATLRRAALAQAATSYESGRLANDFMQQPGRYLDLATQALKLALQALLADYAGDLRSRGRAEEASRWQELAASTRRFEVRSTLERAARSLGSTGWYGVIALLVAILALHITLAAKYWRAQTENLALRAE